ncbi:PadR family transcriptional regulator [Mesorhizobium sp. M0320]|uniref:PadR family transcriptional regulator n=1 Tax=Mesorhizobium sp. M0320 TaxID=2956936 RepID=UPI00333D9994
MIGKFEELALLALIKAGPDAHAAKVYRTLEEGHPKPPAFAALYTSLDRMASKGLISERVDENDPRSKRLFTITGEGRRAVIEATKAAADLGGYDIALA